MRLALTSSLALLFMLAACDGAEPERPRVPSGPGTIAFAPAFVDTTINADDGEALIDLTNRVRHNKGLPLRFTATADGAGVTRALHAQAVTGRLRLVPLHSGAGTVRFQAVADDGTVAEMSFRVRVSVPDRIVTEAPSLVGLGLCDEERIALGRLARHLDSRPIEVTVEAAGGVVGAILVRDTLQLRALSAGDATVNLVVNDRGVVRRVSVPVRVVDQSQVRFGDAFDAAFFVQGQTLRFSVDSTYTHAIDYSGGHWTHLIATDGLTGTAEWTVRSKTCRDDGQIALVVDQRVRGTETRHKREGDHLVATLVVTRSAVDFTRRFTATVGTDVLPRLGLFGVGRWPSSRYVPRSEGTVRGGTNSGRVRYAWTLNADERGLSGWESSYTHIPLGMPQWSETTKIVRLD